MTLLQKVADYIVLRKLKSIISLLRRNNLDAAEKSLRNSKLITSKMHLLASSDVRHLVWALSEFLIYRSDALMSREEIISSYDEL